MNKCLRVFMALALGISSAVWSRAQEETPAPKTPLPKEVQEIKTKAREKRQRERAKAAAEAKAKAVDINHATKDDLKKLSGITDAYADAIIANRPYKSKADLVLKNAIPAGLYQILRKQLVAK